MKKIILLISILLFNTVITVASNDPSVKPREALSKLNGILGEWSITTYYYNPKEQAFQEQAKSTLTASSILKGLGIREQRVSVDDGAALGIDVTYGYDQYRDLYRFVILDDGWGVVDFYEGNIIGDQLIATNVGKNTDFPLANGGKLEFRFNIDLSGDERSVLIEMTADEGKTWSPLYRHDYERIK